MKLYFMPAACSLSPHIVANELGLDVEFIKVDQNDRTTDQGKNFYNINPHGYIPALELEDGNVLREGPVIVQYLADQKPEAGLAPANGTFARYRLQEMLSFLSTEIHKGFIPLLYARQAGDYIETARPKLEKRFAWINEHLADKDFLMGDRFTVADAYLFALAGWGQAPWLKSYYNAPIHFDHLHNLQAWYSRVKGREAVQKSILQEGLELH
ncbi:MULTISPECIES: glutathione transferase GstA [Rhizobium/Agrobacterium group]|uniref:Glutathione transferase GstA n=1 Tax=Rhizobium rhizogenes TaxID=359 RepID=A0A546XEP2_RHIRH|nr:MULTISPECIES: glutathione transferase GstA [Rhizobium/Agrobacterium group]MCZ7482728.1 glutathione transferase GstA [Rhizobium rhizogenes]MDO3444427.1 glutathione transferase GstA [Agrobacterium sp. V1]TRA99233.1 glutathione transferase GstA [Rhizobium rhizogenes]